MSFRSEKAIQNDIIRYLKSVDGLYFNKHSERYHAGVPDIIGCYKGKFFAIEVKNSKGGTVSPIQRKHADSIVQAGGKHIFTNKLEEVVDLVLSL